MGRFAAEVCAETNGKTNRTERAAGRSFRMRMRVPSAQARHRLRVKKKCTTIAGSEKVRGGVAYWQLGGLQFEQNPSSARFQIHRGDTAVVLAQNGGAQAESEAGGFARRLRWHKRIEGARGMKKARS